MGGTAFESLACSSLRKGVAAVLSLTRGVDRTPPLLWVATYRLIHRLRLR